jgi:hypothetical protein
MESTEEQIEVFLIHELCACFFKFLLAGKSLLARARGRLPQGSRPFELSARTLIGQVIHACLIDSGKFLVIC